VDDLSITFTTVAAVTNAPAIPTAGQPQNERTTPALMPASPSRLPGPAPYYQCERMGTI